MNKKKLWHLLLQILTALITALGTAAGVSSCAKLLIP